MVKKVLLVLLAIFVAIQFVRPKRNISEVLITENDISNTVVISGEVHDILRKKCYDCHSNNTTYPWYVNIQPVGWWMAGHVDEGKDELNFSEINKKQKKLAKHKLDEIYD